MMAHRVTWRVSPGEDASELERVLERRGYYFRTAAPGTCYLPSDQGYGDAEDILSDLEPEFSTGTLEVVDEDDPQTDSVYS